MAMSNLYLLAGFAGLLAFCVQTYFGLGSNSHNIPRIGASGLFGYLRSAIRFVTDAEGCIKEGVERFQGHPFIVPTIGGSLYILSPANYEAIKSSDDSVINQPIQVNEALQLDHTMNSDQQGNPFQAAVVRTDVTRGIANFIAPLLDETVLALTEALSPEVGSVSKNIIVFPVFTHLVARISGRVMTGKELCRNKEYEHAIVAFAEALVPKAQLLNWAAAPFRPFLSKILDRLIGGPDKSIALLVPYLRKRVPAVLSEQVEPTLIGDSLILKAPQSEIDNLPHLAMRYMNLSFGSIHTTSINISHALYHLAVMPSAEIETYRREIVEAVENDGWTKAGIAKFKRIDSLLREVGRFYGLGHILMGRLLVKDATLADGSRLPKGAQIALAASQIHFNPAVYEDPYIFQHDRFVKMREKEGTDIKYGFTHQDPDFLLFGAGRHACPGRFFASAELRIMLAYILLKYDLSPANGSKEIPKPLKINGAVVPNAKAQVCFTPRSQTASAGMDLFSGFGNTL